MASSVRAASRAFEVGVNRGASAIGGAGSAAGRRAHHPPVTTQASAAATTTAWRAGSRSTRRPSVLGIDQEQGLAIFHRLPVLDEDLGDAPARLGLDLVHELHRL